MGFPILVRWIRAQVLDSGASDDGAGRLSRLVRLSWCFDDHWSPTMKPKCCHFHDIFITGCTWNCNLNKFHCSQWQKFNQNDDIFFSVNMEIFWSRHHCLEIMMRNYATELWRETKKIIFSMWCNSSWHQAWPRFNQNKQVLKPPESCWLEFQKF